MVQCGRSFGKTEVALYVATRWALTFPGAIIYILTPERKQGKEIYWASRRLQDYPHPSFVKEERDSEMRVVFKNGSFICVDGSDNYNALRGIKPNLVVYDEFQDHDSRVDVAMRPNLGSKRSPLIRIGTPPDREGYYTEVRRHLIERVRAGSARHFYVERPTWTNPYFDKEFLADERRRLIARGDEDEYLREYEGKFIPGGKNAVFPMFHRRKPAIVRDFQDVLPELNKSRKLLRWYTLIDPGQSCFAVMFAAINPYRSKVYLLSEIYEKNRNLTSSGQIWPRIRSIQDQLHSQPDKWQSFYDSAASNFPIELADKFPDAVVYPVKKRPFNKKDDLSHIKDLMILDGPLTIAKECRATISEIESYVTKDDGSFIDKDDHEIDNLRYLLSVSQFSLNHATPEIEEEEKAQPLSFHDLLKRKQAGKDIIPDNPEPYYDKVLNEWV